jgi:class 3 adenylate cyclase
MAPADGGRLRRHRGHGQGRIPLGRAARPTPGPLPSPGDELLNHYWAAAVPAIITDHLASGHHDWPRFRIAVNTGPAVVGNVGADLRRSFTVIGPTTLDHLKGQPNPTPIYQLISATS